MRTLLIALLALTGSACLLGPNQGEVLCGADAEVLFTGYTITPNQVVQIQTSRSRTGPFTAIGTALTSAQSTPFAGGPIYAFSVHLPITDWDSTGDTLRTYVRAVIHPIDPLSPLYLATFDVDPPAGATAADCLTLRVNAGDPLVDAVYFCASPDAPVAELTAPALSTCGCTNTTFTGELIIDDANDAATYVCLETLDGSLVITAEAPESVPLPALRSISGEATLHYERLLPGPNPIYTRRNIDLSALTAIGGDVVIFGRDTNQPSGTPSGLHAVTSIGGDLQLRLWGVHPTLLSSLTHLDGDLIIQGWDQNQGNFDLLGGGLLLDLESVGGDVTIRWLFATNNVLNGLRSIGGTLTLESIFMSAIPSLQALRSVRRDLRFIDTSVNGTFASLSRIGGELAYLDYPTMSTLSFNAVTGARAFALRIENNPALEVLGTGVQIEGGDIHIHANPLLSRCEANGFIAEQRAGGWTGSAFLSDLGRCR